MSAAELCDSARALRTLLTAKPPRDRFCTRIYGGPETARVTGTLDGIAVDRRLKRTDGCEIADYAKAARLLPAA
jgi:hypothetical protein